MKDERLREALERIEREVHVISWNEPTRAGCRLCKSSTEFLGLPFSHAEDCVCTVTREAFGELERLRDEERALIIMCRELVEAIDTLEVPFRSPWLDAIRKIVQKGAEP